MSPTSNALDILLLFLQRIVKGQDCAAVELQMGIASEQFLPLSPDNSLDAIAMIGN